MSASESDHLFAVGNNGMVLESDGTLPYFTRIEEFGSLEVRLELDGGLAPEQLRLEGSTVWPPVWSTLAYPVRSPILLLRLGRSAPPRNSSGWSCRDESREIEKSPDGALPGG